MDLPVVGPIATIMAAPTASEEDPTIRAAAAFFTPEGEKKIKILSLPDPPLKRARYILNTEFVKRVFPSFQQWLPYVCSSSAAEHFTTAFSEPVF